MLTRRGLVAAAALAAPAPLQAASGVGPLSGAFAPMAFTHLDAGATHPIPLGARQALDAYVRFRSADGSAPAGYDFHAKEAAVVDRFCALVGAQADEVCIVQSTTMGENLVIQALDLPRAGGRVVTDALHFFGSFYTYGELARLGMDVVTLPMTREGRIDMDRMAAAITPGTRLVSVSAVSTVNGFQHDLKLLADLAHAKGAFLYVDMVHAVGASPIDLRAAGVDFAACSSYKWLMGDFGLGFLYVRREAQEHVRRPWWGYHQVDRFQSHVFPYDPPGPRPATYAVSASAAGLFGMGTTSWMGIVLLDHSLDLITRLGVASIEEARQPLVQTVQAQLRSRGYQPLTPLDSRSALVAFALPEARRKLAEPLKAAKVRVTLADNRLRVSLAAFNTMDDVQRLLAALPQTPPA